MLLVIAKNWKITRALAIVYEPIENNSKTAVFYSPADKPLGFTVL
jgi:hypothetical protein